MKKKFFVLIGLFILSSSCAFSYPYFFDTIVSEQSGNPLYVSAFEKCSPYKDIIVRRNFGETKTNNREIIGKVGSTCKIIYTEVDEGKTSRSECNYPISQLSSMAALYRSMAVSDNVSHIYNSMTNKSTYSVNNKEYNDLSPQYCRNY